MLDPPVYCRLHEKGMESVHRITEGSAIALQDFQGKEHKAANALGHEQHAEKATRDKIEKEVQREQKKKERAQKNTPTIPAYDRLVYLAFRKLCLGKAPYRPRSQFESQIPALQSRQVNKATLRVHRRGNITSLSEGPPEPRTSRNTPHYRESLL